VSSGDRLVLVPLSPRVAPGLLSAAVWDVVRSGAAVCAGSDGHPQSAALAAAGVTLQPVPDAREFRERARGTGTAVWLGGDPAADEAFTRALGAVVLPEPGGGPQIEVLPGSWDLPGARLLDAVAVMHRLRSPGGCPWDAEQSHATLKPYLLEEAYEAYQAIEDGDAPGLREELGDVLLQVLFHARLGEEESPPWSVDDVAAGLVDKLVGRHPHVFGDASVRDADHVEQRWEELKAAEKSRSSVVDGVPLAMASLALAAKLQRRAARVGLPPDVYDPGDGLAGDLWRLVARPGGAEAEAELRAVGRDFRDRLAAAEARARAEGREPGSLSADEWRARWLTG